MRSTKIIHVISAHAGGEVGDVIVGGVAPPPGETLWEQSRWVARDQMLRNFVLLNRFTQLGTPKTKPCCIKPKGV